MNQNNVQINGPLTQNLITNHFTLKIHNASNINNILPQQLVYEEDGQFQQTSQRNVEQYSQQDSQQELCQNSRSGNSLELPIELNDEDGPTLFYCTNCQMESVSLCKYKSSLQTVLCACLMFLAFNIAGLAIPFCVNTCKDRQQICPRCNNLVGVKQFRIIAY